MKTLILVRHARAEDKSILKRDFDRRLTASGLSEAALIGEYLKGQKCGSSYFISSPASRTVETAEVVMKSLSVERSQLHLHAVLYEADVEEYLEIIRETDDHFESCMIFGHNPTISEVANFLCKDFRNDLSKGAVVALKFKVERWSDVKKETGKLLFFASPKLL